MKKSTPMPHWIMRRKNNNSPTFVLDGPWNPESLLRGEAVIIKVDNLDAIDYISRIVSGPTKIEYFIYEDFDSSLETLDIRPNWRGCNIIFRIGRLGKFSNVAQKLALIKALNIQIQFDPSSEVSCRDVQIVSSLGINTGIVFNGNMPLNDSLKDLVAYNFYSPMRHGAIEPFATMEKLFCGENYVSPEMAFFEDESKYIHINESFQMATSSKKLEKGEFIGKGQEGLYNIYHVESTENPSWQRFFIESHPCSFCPAFRVCKGFFSDNKSPKECQPLMMDILEGIEYSKKIKNNEKNGNHNI